MSLLLKVIVVFFVLVLVFGLVILLVQWGERKKAGPVGPGDPLFLTKYLNKNTSIIVVKEAALVLPFDGKTKSYSGFITVDEEYDSNLFFWYFPAEKSGRTAPVILWIQGGPGVSSVYGVFLENGPHIIVGKDSVKKREDYWSKYSHMIFIDNSVGTGFSFTKNESGYSTTGDEVCQNIYKALKQIFKLFPEIRNNDFYISGESYGGRYVPLLAQYIHNSNQNSSFKINLKGLTIGNGLIDAQYQMVYSKYLHQISLIDEYDKAQFEKLQGRVIYLIKHKQYLEANHALSELITSEFSRTSLFKNVTGFKSITNYLVSNEPNYYKSVKVVLKNDWLRRKINVGNTTFIDIDHEKARRKLVSDLLIPSGPILGELLNNYRVLIYNGQLDIFMPYTGSENVARHLEWCGSNEFNNTKRTPWVVDGIIAGYTKTVKSKNANCTGELNLVLVRNSGHVVTRDQPVWSLNMITKFTQKLPFN